MDEGFNKGDILVKIGTTLFCRVDHVDPKLYNIMWLDTHGEDLLADIKERNYIDSDWVLVERDNKDE